VSKKNEKSDLLFDFTGATFALCGDLNMHRAKRSGQGVSYSKLQASV
jgi:hypothetical protein